MPAVNPPEELVVFCTAQYPRVLGTLRLLVREDRLAEDLAQEAFVRLCRDWERVSRLAAPGAWVHRVAVNLAISAFRRRGAEGRAQVRAQSLAMAGGASDDPQCDPGDREAVLDALARLDERLRAVLVLRYYADLSVAEVADVLRIPEGTVKTATRRALESLRVDGIIEEVQVHD